MNQQQSAENPQHFKSVMNWVMFVLRALATSAEVFLHKANTFGVRYLGPQVVGASFAMFSFPMLFPGYDINPFVFFVFCFLGRCVVVRIRTAIRHRRGGPIEHSFYSGRPFLMDWMPRVPEERVKATWEPLLLFVFGLSALSFNVPVGAYWMVASVALLVTVNMNVASDRSRAIDMNDAMLDQRRVSDMWRGIRPN